MINTVLPSVGRGGLSKILSSQTPVPGTGFLHAGAWTTLCHKPEVSQVLPLLLPAMSCCAWWINFSIEQMQPSWGERHGASPQGKSCQGLCAPLNARYLHTSLGCSHHYHICLVKNRVCTLAGPALASAFPCWGWAVVWAGRSSWHSQAPCISSPLTFWSSGCSKWTDFVWIRGSKRFCSIPGCKGLSLQDVAVFILP